MDQSAKIQELIDRQEIYDVLLRYCRGVDRIDAELLASVYHEDAKVTYAKFAAAGNDVDSAIMKSTKQGNKRTMAMHGLMNHFCRVEGDVANSETYFVMWARVEGSPEMLEENAGRYLDRFERKDDEWRIAERLIIWDWRRSTALPVPFDQIGGDTKGFRSAEDASYKFLPQ